MKHIIFCLLISCSIISCETIFQHTYVIKNQTSHRIEIKGYDRVEYIGVINDTVKYTSEIINIEPNSEYRNIQEAGYHSENQGIFDTWGIDSITIVFDSKKIITYACNQPDGTVCPDKYNLMNRDCNYTKRKTGRASRRNEYTYTYTITEDDYDFAKWMK